MNEYTFFLFSRVLSKKSNCVIVHFRGYLFGIKIDRIVIKSSHLSLTKQHTYLFKLKAIKEKNHSLYVQIIDYKGLEEMSTFF